MPRPDNFFIPLKDEQENCPLSKSATSSVASTMTASGNTDIENRTNQVQDITGSGKARDSNDSDGNDKGDDDDDFEEVDNDKNGTFTQEHGLLDRKFAITVELGPSGRSLEETEDNRDLIQGVRDQYTLIKTKYLPAVKKWLQVNTNTQVYSYRAFLCYSGMVDAFCLNFNF